MGLDRDADMTDEHQNTDQPVKEESLGRKLLGLLLMILVCFGIVLLITQFVLQRNTVIGVSMSPTLEDHDEVFVEKITRLFPNGIGRGDIVTADSHHVLGERDETVIIKRVIGLPGERVTIRGGQVFIDGVLLEEPYLEEGLMTYEHVAEYAVVELGEDEYYLMGDNRTKSRDSRDIGPISRKDIEGRLLVRFYPLDKIGKPR